MTKSIYTYDTNPYYHPEKTGLTKVAELDFSSGSYEFDITAVWTYGDEKKFYWADDSGCSCPIPFEYLKNIGEMQSGPFKVIRDHLNRRFDREGWGNYVKITELHPVLEKLHKIEQEWED